MIFHIFVRLHLPKSMKKKIIHNSLPFLVLLFQACANIVAPTGGDNDTQAPKLLAAMPQNKSTAFASKRIRLLFDERVELKNIQNISIMPEMDEKPTFSFDNKVITIYLKGNLKPKTTYSINFGNNIVDITENNAFPNFNYVFSTGNILDSLVVLGQTVDAFTQKPAKMLVALYESPDDSVYFKQKPDYFTVSDEKTGAFELPNLRFAAYQMLAFKDKNNDFLYDNSEELAFYDQKTIEPQAVGKNIMLYGFKDISNQKIQLKEAKTLEMGKIRLVFNQYLDTLLLDGLNALALEKNYFRDTFFVFHNDFSTDSLRFNVRLPVQGFSQKVSVGNKKKTDALPKNLLRLPEPALCLDTKTTLRIAYQRPIKQINIDLLSQLVVRLDSVLIDLPKKVRFEGHFLYIQIPLKAKRSHKMVLPSGLLTDVFGLKSKADTLVFLTLRAEDYGEINFVDTENFRNGAYILEVLDAQNQVVGRFTDFSQRAIGVPYLQPNTYSFRIVVDSDANRRWTNGSLGARRQAERIIYLQEKMQVKANSELEVSLKGLLKR